MQKRLSLPLLLLTGALVAQASGVGVPLGERALGHPDETGPDFQARSEKVTDFTVYAGEARTQKGFPDVRLERVTTAVPWPRGLVVADGDLVVLARGRHRNAGGIDPSIQDFSGSLFRIDPDIFEPVISSEQAGYAVRKNGELFVEAKGEPFRLYDPAAGPPIEATRIDRPYCTLAWDEVSKNFFICGYSGVDLPAKRFRKNATDSILRYDMRDEAWHVVEQHDPTGVDPETLDYVVSNQHYPHHDPASNPAPHGLLNGPDGALVVGRYLYAVGKDNHTIARYDLDEVRRDSAAPAPPSQVALGADVRLRLPDGSFTDIDAMGPSALAARDGYLYVGYRTSSVVLRFALDEDGALLPEPVAELIAAFEPWSPETGRSANLIDLAFNSKGELFVACAQAGRIWNIGQPDPDSVFDGNDYGESPTANQPYVDLPSFTGNPKARCGNITFDETDRLYICSGNYDSGTRLAGVIYRALPPR